MTKVRLILESLHTALAVLFVFIGLWLVHHRGWSPLWLAGTGYYLRDAFKSLNEERLSAENRRLRFLLLEKAEQSLPQGPRLVPPGEAS